MADFLVAGFSRSRWETSVVAALIGGLDDSLYEDRKKSGQRL
jgi:hypothetical protein